MVEKQKKIKALTNYIGENLSSSEDYDRGDTYETWKEQSYYENMEWREKMAKDIIDFLENLK